MSGGFWDYRNDNLQSDIFGWGIDTTEEAMKVNPLKYTYYTKNLFYIYVIVFKVILKINK